MIELTAILCRPSDKYIPRQIPEILVSEPG